MPMDFGVFVCLWGTTTVTPDLPAANWDTGESRFCRRHFKAIAALTQTFTLSLRPSPSALRPLDQIFALQHQNPTARDPPTRRSADSTTASSQAQKPAFPSSPTLLLHRTIYEPQPTTAQSTTFNIQRTTYKTQQDLRPHHYFESGPLATVKARFYYWPDSSPVAVAPSSPASLHSM
ncbi:hypothetical protein IWX90DRAFT_479639 [Phyllosticta citrichinensis]|uniref:Uncharacterized protein n=1 Tax=Phyllosticta citrichinensis TaxID=1130410 RepID=A0ABR1XP02_9PEZI